MTAVPAATAASRGVRPLDADCEAYALGAAPLDAVPVSRALVRALVAVVGRRGAVVRDGARGLLRLEHAAGPLLLAVPCARPPRTAECARCGHWEDEHNHPAVVSACGRYQLMLGRARFKLPEHDGVAYAWVRRMGRARLVFEISEPCGVFPGGTLTVHRYPAPGDGRAVFGVHRWVIPAERRAWWLERARAHVR
ncbi:hypothetical protein [Streptomyces pseudogriseolus]|uniref:hypothetical protein n=1 Tax=Streptomyces pseudogriseolus TaxID=36817 RepID=UPI000A3B9994